MSSVIRVSKPGIDAFTAQPKDLQFTTELDSPKIVRTGELRLSLPSEILNASDQVRTVSYNHDLGYVPCFLPLARGIVNTDDLATGGDYVVNDREELDIPAGGFGPGLAGEIVTVYVSTTELILEVNRYNAFPIDQTFGARDVLLYYVILHNRMDETFNLI